MNQETLEFTAPIPGQSLTREPGNAPYEQPPEIVNAEEALMGHLNYFNDADILEKVIAAVDFGFDIETIVEGYLRASVLEGLHTIDVSLAIKKPLMEFISKVLDAVGVSYAMTEEDLSEEVDESLIEIDKELQDLKRDESAREVFIGELGELDMEEEQPTEETIEQEIPEEEAPVGLMARGS
tara:strand:+ start:3261 stop:3806 length:546 start_codon:yes stop_codon:yes gene_type:complete